MSHGLAGALLLGLVATVESTGSPPEAHDRAHLAAMESKIDRLIGEAACGSVATCRAVPFGAKPCGGPWKYKVYSTQMPNAVELLRQIDDYNAQNAKLNRQYGWTSDCSVVAPPVLTCREGRCVGAASPTSSAP